MQKHSEKKNAGRLGTFLKSSQGQIFVTCCAYSALGCTIIGFVLSDYTRLAWPFVVASFFLAILGQAAYAHRRFAQVVLLLWVIQANSIGVTVFNLGDQANQQAQLQQQTIQLENQLHRFQGMDKILATQLPLLQQLLDETKDPDNSFVVSDSMQTTQMEQLSITTDRQLLRADIDDNIFLLRDNLRNLPTSSLVTGNNEEMQSNAGSIQFYQKELNDATQVIADNTLLLPREHIPTVSTSDQKNCVNGFVCLAQYSWQQSFIDGWQSISSVPFTATWPFWLSLLLGIAGMFLLLPRNLSQRWVVTYRVRYIGTLAHLNDPAFPEQKRRDLRGETPIVNIEIRSSRFLLKQKAWPDEARELLRLNLGLGTTIQDAFLKQTTTEHLSEASYDTTSGDIVIKVKPLVPLQFAPHTPYKAKRAALRGQRRFPIQLYVVVDYFSGSLTATTPIAEVECLREQRGPTWLVSMAAVFHELVWWIYATGLYIALSICSTMFFRGAPYTYPPVFIPVGLGGLIAALILQLTEMIIMHKTIRKQNIIKNTSYNDIAM
ncbi:hypothetical protein [Dictyobacter formicarum]|uniref:Uncharacterized protein n=1 Tax=Dictyobacter formicarum TaxID=2778368 RepID=A0ABQ3V8U2_9CHLR|nr:hypothetical protein [Dictyobacter formicarum]GHO82312.1 hypothetical protein KSZ_03180 [Dictyobacter formicarum]